MNSKSSISPWIRTTLEPSTRIHTASNDILVCNYRHCPVCDERNTGHVKGTLDGGFVRRIRALEAQGIHMEKNGTTYRS